MHKKLINTKTAQLLVEFKGKETFIYNKFLEQEMQTMGIPIPHGLRGSYQGKESVYLGDQEFQRAFKEVYYLTAMNPELFHWQE